MTQDLFGENGGPPAKRAKPKKKPSEHGAAIAECFAAWQAQHQRRHGVPPMFSRGRDAKIFKDLLEQIGRDETLRLIEGFFQLRDPAVERGGFTVLDLRVHAPRLRLRLVANRPVVHERTARNADAVRRAVGDRSDETHRR